MSQNGEFRELCERLGLHESMVTMVVATMAKRFNREHYLVIQALLGTAKALAGIVGEKPVLAGTHWPGAAVELLESMAAHWHGEVLRLQAEVERLEAEAVSRGVPGSMAADALRMQREGVLRCHGELTRAIGVLKEAESCPRY